MAATSPAMTPSFAAAGRAASNANGGANAPPLRIVEDLAWPSVHRRLHRGGGERGRRFHRGHPVLHRLLHLLESPHLDLAHAFARDRELVGQVLERDRL